MIIDQPNINKRARCECSNVCLSCGSKDIVNVKKIIKISPDDHGCIPHSRTKLFGQIKEYWSKVGAMSNDEMHLELVSLYIKDYNLSHIDHLMIQDF